MAIVEHAELSEINLRFRGGALVGRECWHRTTVQKDDVTISETGEKTTLTDEELAAILGGTTADLTAQVEALEAERDAAVNARTTAEAAQATAEAAVAAKDEQIAALAAQVAALQSPPAPDNPSVTAVQARIALKQADLLDDVEKHIAGLPEGDEARIYWEYATAFHRSHPLLSAVAEALGLSEGQVDTLFAMAQQVQ